MLLNAGELRVINVIGCGQLIAWGILFYSTPTLLSAASQELGHPPSTGLGAFTAAMLASGFLARRAGRWVDQHGARAALTVSCVVGASAMALPGLAPSVPSLFACAALLGIAMASGLYDTAFAAMVQFKGERARPYMIGVTLYGGLASSVFWPLTLHLLPECGARRTFGIYSGALVLLALLYRALLGRAESAGHSGSEDRAGRQANVAGTHFELIAFAFAGVATVTSGIGANFPKLFSAYAMDPWAHAVVPTMVGITQTAARAGELVVGARRSAVWWGAIAIGGLGVAVALLLAGFASAPAAFLGSIAYGACGGLLSTARASVTVTLFGGARAGALFGALAARESIPRAIAPWLFALISDALGASVALTLFGVLAVAAAAMYFVGARLAAARMVSG